MNSEVGFSVTIGLLMGMGRTITQKSELWRNTVLYLGMIFIRVHDNLFRFNPHAMTFNLHAS